MVFSFHDLSVKGHADPSIFFPDSFLSKMLTKTAIIFSFREKIKGKGKKTLVNTAFEEPDYRFLMIRL